MGRLSGKIAIVTGAASGIGKATVELFRAEGATVVGADVSEGADAIADAGSEADVERTGNEVAKTHGGLDIFFANAGISGGFASISEQSAEDWAEILRVNLIGPFLAIKYAAPLIKLRGGGSIVCTASVAGLRSGAGGAAYSASKAGVINLVQIGGAAAFRHRRARQRDLPGPDRNRHDQTDLRHGQGVRPGKAHRRAEPRRTRRRARGDRPSGAVPRLGRVRATSTVPRWWSTAACRAAIRPPAASTSGCCEPCYAELQGLCDGRI